MNCITKENSSTDGNIAHKLPFGLNGTGKMNKAEEYYRKTLNATR